MAWTSRPSSDGKSFGHCWRAQTWLFINQAVRLVFLRVVDLLRPWSVKAYLGRRTGYASERYPFEHPEVILTLPQ
jgi:hypothetical protein